MGTRCSCSQLAHGGAIPVLCSSPLRSGSAPCCCLLFTDVHDCLYLTGISFHLHRFFFLLSNKVNLGKWKAVGEKYLFLKISWRVTEMLQMEDSPCTLSAWHRIRAPCVFQLHKGKRLRLLPVPRGRSPA